MDWVCCCQNCRLTSHGTPGAPGGSFLVHNARDNAKQSSFTQWGPNHLHQNTVEGSVKELENMMKIKYTAPQTFDIDCLDETSNTALHKAASAGHLEACNILYLCWAAKASSGADFSCCSTCSCQCGCLCIRNMHSVQPLGCALI